MDLDHHHLVEDVLHHFSVCHSCEDVQPPFAPCGHATEMETWKRARHSCEIVEFSDGVSAQCTARCRLCDSTIPSPTPQLRSSEEGNPNKLAKPGRHEKQATLQQEADDRQIVNMASSNISAHLPNVMLLNELALDLLNHAKRCRVAVLNIVDHRFVNL